MGRSAIPPGIRLFGTVTAAVAFAVMASIIQPRAGVADHPLTSSPSSASSSQHAPFESRAARPDASTPGSPVSQQVILGTLEGRAYHVDILGGSAEPRYRLRSPGGPAVADDDLTWEELSEFLRDADDGRDLLELIASFDPERRSDAGRRLMRAEPQYDPNRP